MRMIVISRNLVPRESRNIAPEALERSPCFAPVFGVPPLAECSAHSRQPQCSPPLATHSPPVQASKLRAQPQARPTTTDSSSLNARTWIAPRSTGLTVALTCVPALARPCIPSTTRSTRSARLRPPGLADVPVHRAPGCTRACVPGRSGRNLARRPGRLASAARTHLGYQPGTSYPGAIELRSTGAERPRW